MNNSDAENDTQPTALRRNLLKLTAGVGVTTVVGSSSVAAYYDDDDSNSSTDVNYTPNTGSVSFASPEDGATRQNPVTFEMEATDFTIEPASSGVSDGAGHFHILVDQDPLSPGEVIPNNEQNGYYHYGGGQKTAELDLDPGEHTVHLQAGDANHRAYDLTDTMSVTAEPSVNYTPSTGSVSFASPEDGATEQNPVTFEMEAADFTIEPASSGVSDGAGHFHILVDQEPLSPGEVIPNNEQNGYYHYGGGQTAAELDLDPGEHTVRLQAGDANHRAYDLTDTMSVTAEGSTSSEQSTFTMNNVGASAWEVSSTNEEYVETSGGNNPTITLETGIRYTISNEGWSAHPLAFRDESDSILLSQSSEGEFENDGDVNWSASGSTLSFTLTDELANRINSYICTVHSSMVGQIETTESNTVSLNSVNVEPKNIPHPRGGEHTLTFTVQNLSADGGKDEFDIALPSNVEVNSVNIVSITGLESMPDPVASNPIEFSVDPSTGDISSSPVEFVVELDLSVNE